jgi:SAM-dependent methyltransferase
LPLEKRFQVLDVAAGTGHLSLAMAAHVKTVFAIDLTREMVVVAREEMTRRNLNNLLLAEGNAEKLPYETGRFDFVASRLAIHHFKNPIVQLREMVRVCKPNHRIGIVDLLAPEDAPIAKIYNKLERLRDPSHTAAQSKKQMQKLFSDAGIVLEKIEARDVEVDFQRWVRTTETKAEIVEVLREELMKDFHDGSKTGMRPFLKDGSLKFLQVWSVSIGRNIQRV